MSQAQRRRAIILVKAFPQPSQQYEETVCCAGITEAGEFLRLYPIRFRHLPLEQRFARWDVIEFEATRPRGDHRPESLHVSEDSIRIVQRAGLVDNEQRVRIWAPHVSPSIVALRAENKASHKSLGITQPDRGSIKFKARPLKASQQADRDLQDAFKQVSMLDDGPLSKIPVEFEFSYTFTCAGTAHEMKIHDWEVQAAYFGYKHKYGDEALARLKAEYETRIPAQNLHIVLGTMKAHPTQFIIIGLLRSSLDPADVQRQPSLL